MGKLNRRQGQFVEEYLKDLNATRAAERAGYSPKSAGKLMQNPQVLGQVAARQQDRARRTEITQDRVLQELAAMAFARFTDYARVQEGGLTVRDSAELSPQQARAIVGMRASTTGIEVKLADKTKALELLGRHLGLWSDKLNLNLPAIDDSVREMEEYFEQRKGRDP